MQNHTKVYFNFFNYDSSDTILCEMCEAKAVDIHHLEKRNKIKNDFVENLIAICRNCHIKCEQDSLFNCYARIKHLENVCVQIYALISWKKLIKKARNEN